MSTRLIDLVENLPRNRVVVVGDFMMDRYLYGNAERLSPEAPVPVLHFQNEEYRLGGAGNVAAGLAALNGDYLAPYGTGLGQLVLAAIAGLMVACLLWMHRLTVAAPSARFLDDRDGARRTGPAPEEVPAR